jgi:hypothetical protein
MVLRAALDDAGNRGSRGVSAACRRSVTCGGFRRVRGGFRLTQRPAPLACVSQDQTRDPTTRAQWVACEITVLSLLVAVVLEERV